jgi:hypothetical protein
MAESRSAEVPNPDDPEFKAMLPMVLELQKLLEERFRRPLRPGNEVASISLTSCDHHSCN